MPEGAADRREPHDSIKHTLVALLIAFILTLTFRGFVMEGFIIPTGSMAPTLLGEHWRVRSPLGGHDWAINGRVGPRAPGEGIDADDPISRTPLSLLRAGRSAGDRILVLKWAYALADPARWDAAVFKYPEAPRENFIKRIVGLPGEDVWLVDGDVFVREGKGSRDQGTTASRQEGTEARRHEGEKEEGQQREGESRGEEAKERTGSSEPGAEATGHQTDSNASASRPPDSRASDGEWRIARKPAHIQKDLWQPVWSSAAATNTGPLASVPRAESDVTGSPRVESPWTGEGWVWTDNGRALRHEGDAPATLTWDAKRWPIVDWNPYNDPEAPTARDARRYYPVNDVRVRFAVESFYRSWEATIRISAEGAAWRVRLKRTDTVDAEDQIRIERSAPDASAPETSTEEFLAWGGRRYLESPLRGPCVPVEVWLVDHAIEVWVDGRHIVKHEFDASPRERLARAIRRDHDAVTALLGEDAAPIRGNPLADATLYSPPEISISFEGGPVTLHRLAVDRDIYYRPTVMENDPRIPARGTHPSNLARLSPDEFFALGDNSGASRDSRLWDAVDPWVAREIDSEPGVVHRAMLVGKAFFVYFPAPHEVSIAGRGRPLVPDFGRMRWIR